MHTTLWATLTANGNYARNSAEHPPKPQALTDFGRQVAQTGNFVVGRRTFEAFAAGATGPAFGDEVDIVVVTSSPSGIPGVLTAPSPRAALDLLAEKGHQSALLAGGETLHNAFLAEGLVDELVFVITPVLEAEGLHVVLPEDGFAELTQQECEDLGEGVTRMRYRVEK